MRITIWMSLFLSVKANDDWWDINGTLPFKPYQDGMKGEGALPSNQRGQGYACDEVIATLTAEEVYAEVRNLLPTNSTSALNAVEIRKICASCDSVRAWTGFEKQIYDNDFFDMYCGSNVYGHDFIHSGLIMYPMETLPNGSLSYKSGQFRGFVYSRPTVLLRTEAPSGLGLESESLPFGLLGTGVTGMISILPDYMGYGESRHFTDRAYMIKDPYLTAALPLWIKAKSNIHISLNDEAIFAGYSEGGYASVSLGDGFSKALGIDIVKTFASGAPFRLGTTQIMAGVKWQDEGHDPAMYRFIYLLVLASFSSSYPGLANYNVGQDLASDEFLHPNDPEQNIFHWLNDTSATIDGLNQRVPDGWAHIMRKDYLQFFRNAISKNVEDPCGSNYLVGFNDKLCDALLDNDLTDILETATFDIHLCHSTEDDLVPYNNLPDISRNPNYLSLRNTVGSHLQAANRCLSQVVNFLVDPFPFEEDLLGRTFLIPALGFCWKIELFEGGVLAGDYSNPGCLNEFEDQMVLSNFNFGVGNKAHYKQANGWNGHFNINESNISTEAGINVITNDLSKREFIIDLVFPNNYIRNGFYYGKTIYVRGWDACWKIELFENGVMDGDHRPTKARCSKETHQTDLIISNFHFGSGRDAHFKKSKYSIAWTGQMHFKESSDVSEIAFTPILRDFSLQTCEFELTMPLLHHSE